MIAMVVTVLLVMMVVIQVVVKLAVTVHMIGRLMVQNVVMQLPICMV